VESTLDWFGCATFRLRVAGLTIFLDAYIDRAANAAGTGLTADDIDECDWIIVGHSHFDHLWGAERIMANTAARLIGSYETVRVMEAAGVPAERMICVAGGERVDLGHDVTVDVFPSQHSCVWSQRQMSQASEVCLGDLGVTWQEQQARMDELQSFLLTELTPAAVMHLVASRQGHSPRGDGGALVALLNTPHGSLLFQDTSGHWTGILGDLRPDVAIVAAAGRGNIDGQPIQGSLAEFVAREAELLQPARMLLCHHDDWLPGFSVATDLAPIRAAVSARVPSTELIEPGYLAGTEIFAGLRPRL
jgi:L-ascorbate metabolism protein UlaG (beta-lactamase superfamily)